MSGTLTKLAGAELATILERATLSPEAQAPLRGCADVGDAIDRLEAAGFSLEAVRVLAHALPKREGVWWACMCSASTAPADLPEPDRMARETAETWVRQQRDEQRRAAMAHAENGAFQTPEAWVGVAAFWSGDSMSPKGQPAVPPPPHATGGAVAGAVALASARGNIERHAARLKRFLESGRNIATGGPGRIPPEEA
ncbi:MAG: hypothetical protein EXR07_06570 [Acetobacteraceae bacterium]|nr:hypothetical protein [Acetobacteraceae bacterium]